MTANPAYSERAEKKARAGGNSAGGGRQDTAARGCDTAKAPQQHAGAYGYAAPAPEPPLSPASAAPIDSIEDWTAPAINALAPAPAAAPAAEGSGAGDAVAIAVGGIGAGGAGADAQARGSPGRGSTTAQRYAAYRLRAAQANPTKSGKWGR